MIMPELGRNVHFGGVGDVSGEDLGKAEVANFSTDVDRTLHKNFGWSGKAIGVVGLTLSPDDPVASCMFFARGNTELDEFRATCDLIWRAGPQHITLAIKVSSLNMFTFSSGGLWSDLILSHKFTQDFYDRNRDNAPILGATTENEWGAFCLRLVCQLSSTSSGRQGVISST